jgi:hypothetical protein
MLMAYQGANDTLKVLQLTMTVGEVSAECDLDRLQRFCHLIEHRRVPCRGRMVRKGSEKVRALALKAELTNEATFEELKAKILGDLDRS